MAAHHLALIHVNPGFHHWKDWWISLAAKQKNVEGKGSTNLGVILWLRTHHHKKIYYIPPK